jgi:hypothetical protein
MVTLKEKMYQDAASQNWESLEDFRDWYMGYGLPLAMPESFEIYESDDALSFPLFRYKNFQVELYVLHSPTKVLVHAHPYVEVIQFDFNVDSISSSPKLVYPATHGSAEFVERFDASEHRLLLLTFERWPVNSKPSTLAAVWKGYIHGPKQEALIRRFFPDAYINNGYADITRTMNV